MLLCALKYAAAKIYGGIQAKRAAMYQSGRCHANALPCKVVCVGNLTAGGTGKTPMIMYLVQLLQRHNIPAVILSRGYKGGWEQTGGLVSNLDKVLATPEQAGDEPYLLACRLKGTPVYVGRKRYANGLKAMETFNPTVILLDDGYQHLQLARDFNLLLMDATHPLDNGCVIPLGMLREKPTAVNRARAIVFTRGRDGAEEQSYNEVAPYVTGAPRPHFVSGHKPYCYLVKAGNDLGLGFCNVNEFAVPETVLEKGVKVFAFSGIAKNQSFLDSLNTAGVEIVGSRFFNDHYAYCPHDLTALEQAAREAGAEILATTEKDHAKLKGQLGLDLAVFGVQMDFFGKEQAFDAYFLEALQL